MKNDSWQKIQMKIGLYAFEFLETSNNVQQDEHKKYAECEKQQ